MTDEPSCPQGWLARLTRSQQLEVARQMLRIPELSQRVHAAADIGMMEIAATDALDANGFAAMMRANAVHTRGQAAALEEVALVYEEVARLAEQAPPEKPE